MAMAMAMWRAVVTGWLFWLSLAHAAVAQSPVVPAPRMATDAADVFPVAPDRLPAQLPPGAPWPDTPPYVPVPRVVTGVGEAADSGNLASPQMVA